MQRTYDLKLADGRVVQWTGADGIDAAPATSTAAAGPSSRSAKPVRTRDRRGAGKHHRMTLYT
jgi:hypothetical protein